MEGYFKYPRTGHLPWSLGSTSDDKFLDNTECFQNMRIVITEKMDGENTNMYPDRIHARSIDSGDHPSRHWVKGLWGEIRHQIPNDWRICGENLYAKHSIFYEDLSTYFMVFSIWDEKNMCLSWDDTVRICSVLGLKTVPVINIMEYDEFYLMDLANKFDVEHKEGYVIRNTNPFHYDDYVNNVGKWVRQKHIQTDQHWMFQQIVLNKLSN